MDVLGHRNAWTIMTRFLILSCMVLNALLVAADTPPIVENDVQGVIASFGDFDSDKMTDVFLISPDGRTFSILQGFKTEPLLRKNKKWTCTLPTSVSSDENIVALMPSDFHGMAMMDVLVVTKNKNHYSLYLVQGNKHSLECSSLSEPLGVKFKSQPLLVDINGDMITDILGSTLDSTTPSENSKRQVLVFGFNATFERRDLFGVEIPESNSNAFVDLNSDTAPDLFILGDKMEYWFLGRNGFSAPDVTYNIPDYPIIGQSSFVDIDSDGILDHIIPVCRDKNCEDPAIMMKDHEGYKWIEVASGFKTEEEHPKFYGFYLQEKELINQMKFLMTLRFADFNGDGFADFVTLVKEKGSSTPKVALLINVHSNHTKIGRSFSILMPPSQPQSESRKPIIAGFFDLYEDGKADIIVSSVDADSSSNPKNVYVDVLINFKMYDATFIKVMVASGLCYDDCSAVKGPNSTPTFEPTEDNVLVRGVAYGTNQPGPHICHELIDTEGYRRFGCNGQLTQSANFPLQMPYTIFGLGSTPNFVDTLTATIPGPNTSFIRSRAWTQIVPDAQVVLIPYPKDDPDQWRSKLFLTPSDMVLSTLITLASICILLIIVIAFLHRKEILEDIAEHEEYKRHWPDSR